MTEEPTVTGLSKLNKCKAVGLGAAYMAIVWPVGGLSIVPVNYLYVSDKSKLPLSGKDQSGWDI